MKLEKLKESLKEWKDWDIAAYQLGLCLGIFDENTEIHCFQTNLKHIFWSNTILGNKLHELLQGLVKINVLEWNEDECQFRWNQNYDCLKNDE